MIMFNGQELSAPKGFTNGTHRTRSPEETFAVYAPHMAAMGITRIANVTGLDRIGLPVCTAIRPNARALSTAQGKGRTLAAARTSALMEAIESWHGERVTGNIRVATHAELAREVAMPPLADFALRADADLGPAHPVPWVRGWDLMISQTTWVPLDCVSTNFVEGGRSPRFLRSTNGLASGNHLLEAIVHGLNEVIERDALTLASLAGSATAAVDPATVPDPYFRALHDRLCTKGLRLYLDDVTSDIGVPTFSCRLMDDPDSAGWRALPQVDGHGTHLDYEVALSRAVHEAIQSRATVISGSRDDLFPSDYRDAVSAADHLRNLGVRKQYPLITSSRAAASSFEADLETLLGRLRAAGVASVMVVDLTRPPFDIPVVKVVVPGLEPPRTAFYQPGRRAAALLKVAA
jgi:ribosomal protein S12 methylthiotransferase accessory factor